MDADEGRRLGALHRLGLLDTPPEERFDRITRTAQRLLGTPIALITLVDADRLWFKSRQGVAEQQADRKAAFCAEAVMSDEPLAVADALDDARFAANDMVTGEPFLRAYAGVPLHAGGQRVGTLCVMHGEARTFTSEEIDVLRDLARWAESELDRSELAAVLAAQRESEDRLRAFMDAVPEAVAMFDGHGRLLQVNPAGERLFGYRADEVAGLGIDALIADEDGHRRSCAAGWPASLPGDAPVRVEVDGRHAGGSRVPLEVIVSKTTVDGDARYVVAARDLTERRQARQAVERLRRQQGLILEAASEGICGIDSDGMIVFANPSARRLFGLAADDPLGQREPARAVPPVLSRRLALPVAGVPDLPDPAGRGAPARRRRDVLGCERPTVRGGVRLGAHRRGRRGDRRGRHLHRRHRAPGRGTDEERVRVRRQPRAAHAADLGAGVARAPRQRRPRPPRHATPSAWPRSPSPAPTGWCAS